MPHDLVFWLAIATFVVVLAFGAWNYISTRRTQKHGPDVKGLGGRDDPMA